MVKRGGEVREEEVLGAVSSGKGCCCSCCASGGCCCEGSPKGTGWLTGGLVRSGGIVMVDCRWGRGRERDRRGESKIREKRLRTEERERNG